MGRLLRREGRGGGFGRVRRRFVFCFVLLRFDLAEKVLIFEGGFFPKGGESSAESGDAEIWDG